jgi:GT2 family glycosyltransferase
VTVLGAILVTYRRPVHLALSLNALATQTVRCRHLVLVDNGGDGLAESLLEQFSSKTGTEVTYLVPTENLGPAGGFASGVTALSKQLSYDDWVVLLDDDDPLMHPEVLQRLQASRQRLIDREIQLGGIGLKGACFDRRKLRTRSVLNLDNRLAEVDHLHGGFAPMYRLRALMDSGGFRPELFWGFEELDVGLRITRRGWRLFADGETLRATSRSTKLNTLTDRPSWIARGCDPRQYYKRRNLILISLEHCRKRDVVMATMVRYLGKPLANLLVHPSRALQELRCNLVALHDVRTRTLGRTVEL